MKVSLLSLCATILGWLALFATTGFSAVSARRELSTGKSMTKSTKKKPPAMKPPAKMPIKPPTSKPVNPPTHVPTVPALCSNYIPICNSPVFRCDNGVGLCACAIDVHDNPICYDVISSSCSLSPVCDRNNECEDSNKICVQTITAPDCCGDGLPRCFDKCPSPA